VIGLPPTSMRPVRRLALAALAVGLTVPSGQARDCRRENTPPGVRLPQQIGCKPLPSDTVRDKQRPAPTAGRQPGFIDLGNGTQLRISGEADLEVRHRR
jgi:hypothetical protein